MSECFPSQINIIETINPSILQYFVGEDGGLKGGVGEDGGLERGEGAYKLIKQVLVV